MRVTNQDRDQVVEHVKAAYAEGRLDKFEMDERLHQAMTARTHADLIPIMDDLYGVQAAAYTPPPGPAVPPSRQARAAGYHPRAGYPGAVPVDGGDRVGGAAAHLLTLCGLFVVGPLIMLLTAGRTSPFIRRHAAESLNFHLTVLGATLLLPFTVVGLVLIPFIWILGFVLAVVGGVSAIAGGDFRYPLTVRLVK
ncbi:DUF1707 and DUF4870 domain-containing protein [Microtetraspora sp. NBRC 16547]|uniref:DUF1707 and DUF4870 domain-containing protein n=1 Tax=Microtetraspora sp. NBRC 16547 TaxID=3030993 RepID=UPI0025527983|nr:DUF1707 and DUF4870 domain-containing protein [Microtetraspora sp. NBRC 16547]